MVTAITGKIKVTVETYYQKQASDPNSQIHTFTYRITIENQSDSSVQVLGRFWNIYDSMAQMKTVEGEGVVGEQPVIVPGDSYQYVSWCQLQSEFGKMSGYYSIKKLDDNSRNIILIPEFVLSASPRLN
jgi:ApaG protein